MRKGKSSGRERFRYYKPGEENERFRKGKGHLSSSIDGVQI